MITWPMWAEGRGLSRVRPILLTDEIVATSALIRAGLHALPAIVRAEGERASRRFTEFFTASIRNRNTRVAHARAVKRFFAWCDECWPELNEVEATTHGRGIHRAASGGHPSGSSTS